MRENGGEAAFACIWDMDGVLVDSGMAHFHAWQGLAAELGYEFTMEHHLDSLGRLTPDILRIAWGITGPAENVARWTERKEALFREQALALKGLPGAAELVRSLRQAGWKQAVASGGPSANVQLLLGVLGIAGYFQAVLTGDDVTHGKPDPEIFSAAMRKLGTTPTRSIVIEDAVSGVRAARAAGALTIAVTNSRSRQDLEQAGADLVVDTLLDLGPQRLRSLLAARPGQGLGT